MIKYISAANAGIWVQTHTIYYRAVEAGEPPRVDSTASRKGKGQPTKLSSRRKPDVLWNGEYSLHQSSQWSWSWYRSTVTIVTLDLLNRIFMSYITILPL